MTQTPRKKNENASKRKIIWTVIVLCAVLFLLVAVSWAIDRFFKKEQDPTVTTAPHFVFAPADYNENIFEDPEYLSLTGNGVVLMYEESGISQALAEGKQDQLGDKVAFFADFVSFMIRGDVSSYNNCYSQKYYESHEPQSAFTMQKIYDVKLTYYTEETVTDHNQTYTAVTYRLEYCILNNNGTLRSDSLNGNKPLYFTISNREGRWLIDSVGSVHYQ